MDTNQLGTNSNSAEEGEGQMNLQTVDFTLRPFQPQRKKGKKKSEEGEGEGG